MSRRLVARPQDANAWTVTSANGQPSTSIVVTPDVTERLGTPVGAIETATPVLGDRVEAAVAAVDLRDFDDVELWVRADHVANGTDAAPWTLELRLGSAARPIGTNTNSWQRFLPLRGDGGWELVLVSIRDLPAAVRQAVTAVRFTVVDAGRPFQMAIDGPWATRATALADVDDALRALLDGTLTLAGRAVPLVFEPDTVDPAHPALRARQVTTRLRPDLPAGSVLRTDYSGSTFAIRPPSVPAEVGYEVRAAATSRADAAAALEFALTRLATTPNLDVGGRSAPVQVVDSDPLALDRPVITISVVTSLRPEAAPDAAIPPFNRVDVEVDDLARS